MGGPKPVVIPDDKVLEWLEEAVAERGEEYVYLRPRAGVMTDYGPPCLYFDDTGAPSCIVGHVIANAGGVSERYLQWDVGDVMTLHGRGLLEASDTALIVLRVAQHEQDQRRSWGCALETAQRAYRLEMERRG